jgi:hypothetical protein
MHDAKILGPEHLPRELTLEAGEAARALDPASFPIPREGLKPMK